MRNRRGSIKPWDNAAFGGRSQGSGMDRIKSVGCRAIPESACTVAVS
jgi:hypothetical protein